jgi:hypothetical protein
MNSADIIITDEDSNELIKNFHVEDKEFVSLSVKLKKGCYQVKIITKSEENTKSIIVN